MRMLPVSRGRTKLRMWRRRRERQGLRRGRVEARGRCRLMVALATTRATIGPQAHLKSRAPLQVVRQAVAAAGRRRSPGCRGRRPRRARPGRRLGRRPERHERPSGPWPSYSSIDASANRVADRLARDGIQRAWLERLPAAPPLRRRRGRGRRRCRRTPRAPAPPSGGSTPNAKRSGPSPGTWVWLFRTNRAATGSPRQSAPAATRSASMRPAPRRRSGPIAHRPRG